ncbi:MAG: KOW domain-containing RNA-binding protein [Oscillospiraceae bacterium]|jgi:hypothetical protein|nr:KOW domain-containing RNA-binding protein [Oscillospiraceae bacterium]
MTDNSEQITVNSFAEYRLCRSLAGRDKGTLYLKVGESPGRVLVVDGKYHKLAKPKAKNPKHLQLLGLEVEPVNGTDKEIRRKLLTFKACKGGITVER